MRYQVLFSKRGASMPKWFNELSKAKDFARKYERVGYDCAIWQHDNEGARPLYNVLGYTDKISFED